MRPLNSPREVIPLDDYIKDMKKELSRFEFEDPEFNVITREITQAYLSIANGEAYYVPF